jgi:N utilization substance protein B
MVTRRQIRTKVMQAIYACYGSGDSQQTVFKMMLKEIEDELKEAEGKKGLTGDTDLLNSLFRDSIDNAELYDGYVRLKAENWELDRIAKLDRILMHMAICEMLNFPEIPVKVTINEYLELAKTYSTPKSSKFINGILDNLYSEFQKTGLIAKKGRGLLDSSRKQNKDISEESA